MNAMDRTALRLIDANANRAAEGLRVAEDFARLGLNCREFSERLKRLRHELRQALARVAPAERFLAARDIDRDVGTGIATDTESHRSDLTAVAASAFARTKEALRVLEEIAKIESVEAARQIEKIRYALYGLERDVLLATRSHTVLERVRFCLILTGSLCRRPLVETLRAALGGGVDMVQLREKELSDREYLKRAERVRDVCGRANVPFVVNDRAGLAAVLGADGVHLGQDDLPVGEAKALLGPGVLVGFSTHNRAQLLSDAARAADYLGVGPAFATDTKPHEPPAGLEYLREAAASAPRPFFAIGGINAERLEAVLAAGARRIAVSRAVCSAENPEHAAQTLAQRMAT